MCVLSINLMLFDNFRFRIAILTRNQQSSTCFIKYFSQLLWMLQNTVLLKVFDVLQSRKTASSFSENPNAFSMLFGAILRLGLQNHQNT